MKPTAEQLKDPKWWDENSPDGTTHYDPNDECSPWMMVNGSGHWHVWDDEWCFASKSDLVDFGSPPDEYVKRPIHSVDSIDMVKRSKYHHLIAIVDMPDGSKHEVWVDVYDVINAWAVNNPAQQHLIKKALQAGDRGHKDYAEDMDDIIASAERAKDLQR